MGDEKKGGCCGVVSILGGFILVLILIGAIIRGGQKVWEGFRGTPSAPVSEESSQPAPVPEPSKPELPPSPNGQERDAKTPVAEVNEKSMMLSSTFFGDLAKARKIKKSGKIQLQPWDPYIKYTRTIPDNPIKNVMLQNINKLNIKYTEIWISVMDDGFTAAEKRKYKGQFDISKIYFLNNKVQAATLEKYYLFNPVTNKRVGQHKITQVWDRDSVLREISK
jgi:hypothetical protein